MSGLHSSQLQGLLNASYDKKIRSVDGFHQDRGLSTKTSKVYTNPETGQTVVAHKGTSGILDWGNNAIYALGGEQAYRQTPRFKEAQHVQNQAQKKYDNVTTIGHSQGGLQAELLGKTGHETITLNKATRPFSNVPSKNQFDIRTQNDVVSALNPFQRQKHSYTISSNLNPLAAHSIDTLQGLNHQFGKGLRLGRNNITTSSQIDEMAKEIPGYHGCFTLDELPDLKSGYYVINLNGHSHWTCLYKNGNQFCYYDSFGFQPPQELEDRIEDYFWNNKDIQDLNSTACGYYCVAFMRMVKSLRDFERFVNLFDKDTRKNDMILRALIKP